MCDENNFSGYNKITITGKIIKEYPIKQTLNKKIRSFVIQHDSLINENGNIQNIKCKLYCIIINENILLEPELINKNVVLEGFISQNASGNLVLYVKQIKFYKGL
jgi:hypothetical protein